jgi:hypothetical protein
MPKNKKKARDLSADEVMRRVFSKDVLKQIKKIVDPKKGGKNKKK